MARSVGAGRAGVSGPGWSPRSVGAGLTGPGW